MAMLGLHRY